MYRLSGWCTPYWCIPLPYDSRRCDLQLLTHCLVGYLREKERLRRKPKRNLFPSIHCLFFCLLEIFCLQTVSALVWFLPHLFFWLLGHFSRHLSLQVGAWSANLDKSNNFFCLTGFTLPILSSSVFVESEDRLSAYYRYDSSRCY